MIYEHKFNGLYQIDSFDGIYCIESEQFDFGRLIFNSIRIIAINTCLVVLDFFLFKRDSIVYTLHLRA